MQEARADMRLALVAAMRDGDAVAAPRTHARASTEPKSPSVGASACAYMLLSALMRAVARHPAMTSCALPSMVNSAASESAAMSIQITF